MFINLFKMYSDCNNEYPKYLQKQNPLQKEDVDLLGGLSPFAKKSAVWERLGACVTSEMTKKFIDIMNGDALTPHNYVMTYLAVLEYFRPKLSKVESQLEVNFKMSLTDYLSRIPINKIVNSNPKNPLDVVGLPAEVEDKNTKGLNEPLSDKV
jgi:hypothetical protein